MRGWLVVSAREAMTLEAEGSDSLVDIRIVDLSPSSGCTREKPHHI